MKLLGLKKIYADIKNKNVTYGVFDFNTNGVLFNIYFDVGLTPFKLGFLPIGDNRQVWLEVKKGFEINSNLDKKSYYDLIDILGLKKDKENPFSPFKFFVQFNNAIPDSINPLSDYQRVELTKKRTSIEEENKTVFDGLIDWDKGVTGNLRSAENLEKTRLLLPKTYDQIKDKNISVRYKVK